MCSVAPPLAIEFDGTVTAPFENVQLPYGYMPVGTNGPYTWGGFLAYIALAAPVSGSTCFTQEHLIAHLKQLTHQFNSIAGSGGPLSIPRTVTPPHSNQGDVGCHDEPQLPPDAKVLSKTVNADGTITLAYEKEIKVETIIKVTIPDVIIPYQNVSSRRGQICIDGVVIDLSILVGKDSSAQDLFQAIKLGHIIHVAKEFIKRYTIERICEILVTWPEIVLGRVHKKILGGIWVQVLSREITRVEIRTERVVTTYRPSSPVVNPPALDPVSGPPRQPTIERPPSPMPTYTPGPMCGHPGQPKIPFPTVDIPLIPDPAVDDKPSTPNDHDGQPQISPSTNGGERGLPSGNTTTTCPGPGEPNTNPDNNGNVPKDIQPGTTGQDHPQPTNTDPAPAQPGTEGGDNKGDCGRAAVPGIEEKTKPTGEDENQGGNTAQPTTIPKPDPTQPGTGNGPATNVDTPKSGPDPCAGGKEGGNKGDENKKNKKKEDKKKEDKKKEDKKKRRKNKNDHGESSSDSTSSSSSSSDSDSSSSSGKEKNSRKARGPKCGGSGGRKSPGRKTPKSERVPPCSGSPEINKGTSGTEEPCGGPASNPQGPGCPVPTPTNLPKSEPVPPCSGSPEINKGTSGTEEPCGGPASNPQDPGCPVPTPTNLPKSEPVPPCSGSPDINKGTSGAEKPCGGPASNPQDPGCPVPTPTNLPKSDPAPPCGGVDNGSNGGTTEGKGHCGGSDSGTGGSCGGTTITHSSTCRITVSGGGNVDCDCGGSGGLATASLMAQLQSLLLQLQVQTGGKVITPKLNVTMTCDATEIEEEEITLELNIHYRGRKTTTVNHSGWCEQTRSVLGAVGQGTCQFSSL